MAKIINTLSGAVWEYEVSLPSRWLGYMRDRYSQRELKDYIATHAIFAGRTPITGVSSLDIQPYCEDYCEAPLASVYDSVERYLDDLKSGKAVAAGWRAGGYKPRKYAASPATFMLGEALTGWYLESQGWQFFHRTAGNVAPDFYMVRGPELAIVEVKTTTKEERRRGPGVPSAQIKEAAISVLNAWSALLHMRTKPNPTIGYAIKVALIDVRNIMPAGSDLEANVAVLIIEVV